MPTTEIASRRPLGLASTRDSAAYESLRAAIFEVQLPPGTKLPEDALAETFGISRTGVRKVLQRLAHERLVDLRPNRGATIAQPSVKEAREVFAARRMIECGAISHIIAQIKPVDVSKLRNLLKQEDDAQQSSDRTAAIRLSGEFHTRLIALTQNELLTDFLGDLVACSSLIIAMYGPPISAPCRHSNHGQLLDLIESRNLTAAVKWMDQHLNEVEASCVFEGEDPVVPDLKRILGGIARRCGTGS
jgi:DNA-binding GntR family transcriptional regulator